MIEEDDPDTSYDLTNLIWAAQVQEFGLEAQDSPRTNQKVREKLWKTKEKSRERLEWETYCLGVLN